MKKLTALFLAVLLCFSFAACGGNAEPDTTEPSAKEDSEGFPEWELHEDGYYIISEEELATYMTEIEVTTENWQDFFSVKEIVKYNAFGEVEEKEEWYGAFLPCWLSDDFAIEISDGNESVILDSRSKLRIHTSSMDISNLTCLRVQGKIIVADVPDELWRTVDNEDVFVFKDVGVYNGKIVGFAYPIVRKECQGNEFYGNFEELINSK